jgi:hypothetical protein
MAYDWAIAMRVEYYLDDDDVIVSSASGQATHTWGESSNLD